MTRSPAHRVRVTGSHVRGWGPHPRRTNMRAAGYDVTMQEYKVPLLQLRRDPGAAGKVADNRLERIGVGAASRAQAWSGTRTQPSGLVFRPAHARISANQRDEVEISPTAPARWLARRPTGVKRRCASTPLLTHSWWQRPEQPVALRLGCTFVFRQDGWRALLRKASGMASLCYLAVGGGNA